MPMETETFRECFEPNWGISMDRSDASTTSCDTPATSFPKTRAYLAPGSGLKSCNITEFSVCSTLIMA